MADLADMKEEQYDDVLASLFDYLDVMEENEQDFMMRDKEKDNMYMRLLELIDECKVIIEEKEEEFEE